MADPFFSPVVELLLAKQHVAMADLMWFDFASQPMRLWNGFGPLQTGDGSDDNPLWTWQGLGDLGRIEGLDLSPGLPTDGITVALTGLETFVKGGGPAIAAIVRNQVSECNGRRARLYRCWFDPSQPNGWIPVTPPLALRTFVMGRLSLDIDHNREAATHVVRLQLEPATIDKHRAPHDLLMDRHHQVRWPGDKGLERMSYYDGKRTTVW